MQVQQRVASNRLEALDFGILYGVSRSAYVRVGGEKRLVGKGWATCMLPRLMVL